MLELGGLILKLIEIKNVGYLVITKLITLGSWVTFIGGAITTHFVFNLSWDLSFLFSALIIVTGSTVITPILRNIPLKKDVSAILKWEGILIDPIGALVAVLVFEFISIEGGWEFTKTALVEFGKIVLFGSTFGFTFAHESGLLAVVVMGMVLGNSNSTYLKELLYFKESVSILLIIEIFQKLKKD